MIASGLVDFALRDAPETGDSWLPRPSFPPSACSSACEPPSRIPEMVGHPRETSGRPRGDTRTERGSQRDGDAGRTSKHGAGGSGAHGPVERRREGKRGRSSADGPKRRDSRRRRDRTTLPRALARAHAFRPVRARSSRVFRFVRSRAVAHARGRRSLAPRSPSRRAVSGGRQGSPSSTRRRAPPPSSTRAANLGTHGCSRPRRGGLVRGGGVRDQTRGGRRVDAAGGSRTVSSSSSCRDRWAPPRPWSRWRRRTPPRTPSRVSSPCARSCCASARVGPGCFGWWRPNSSACGTNRPFALGDGGVALRGWRRRGPRVSLRGVRDGRVDVRPRRVRVRGGGVRVDGTARDEGTNPRGGAGDARRRRRLGDREDSLLLALPRWTTSARSR